MNSTGTSNTSTPRAQKCVRGLGDYIEHPPMLRRTSTTEAVIAVSCGQNSVSSFPSAFSFSNVKNKFQQRPAFEKENVDRADSPVHSIGDDEFRKLKEAMRSTGMMSTNGVRHALLCSNSPR